MAFQILGTRVHADTYWFILAAVFLTIGIVGSLGEWVFHWWDDPFHWLAPASLALGLLAVGWGASGRDLRGFRKASTAEHRALYETQGRILEGQEKLVEGQQKLVGGQEKLVAGQEKYVVGQEKLVEGQQQLVAGQKAVHDQLAQANGALREMVASFRRP